MNAKTVRTLNRAIQLQSTAIDHIPDSEKQDEIYRANHIKLVKPYINKKLLAPMSEMDFRRLCEEYIERFSKYEPK